MVRLIGDKRLTVDAGRHVTVSWRMSPKRAGKVQGLAEPVTGRAVGDSVPLVVSCGNSAVTIVETSGDPLCVKAGDRVTLEQVESFDYPDSKSLARDEVVKLQGLLPGACAVLSFRGRDVSARVEGILPPELARLAPRPPR